METPVTAPFGQWKSPISSTLLGADGVLFESVATSDGKVYVTECRPKEEGRGCIVDYSGLVPRDILPTNYDAGTKVHEYGGASMIAFNGYIVFTDRKTQDLHRLDPSRGQVEQITKTDAALRYACTSATGSLKANKPGWLLAIEEDHTKPLPSEVRNRLVAVNLQTKEIVNVASGDDFYSAAQFSPDGSRICWTQWSHPDMPWTGARLYVAKWNNGEVADVHLVAGAPEKVSVSQPRWGVDNTLYFTSDVSGYWQLYRCRIDTLQPQRIVLRGLEDVDFSQPDWRLGNCTYVGLTQTSMVASYTKNARWSFILIDLSNDSWQELNVPVTDTIILADSPLSETKIALLGSSETSFNALFTLDIAETAELDVLQVSSEFRMPDSLISKPEHISFPRVLGEHLEGEAHAIFYPPQNPDYQAPSGTLPPLIVCVHGGPTSQTGTGLNIIDQYWTSRGYAVVWVNYGGSSGYGRAYRDILNGRWGVLDTADTASCLSYLASSGRINPNGVGIRGGSAGGYIVLQALCDYPHLFAGGNSLYGISNVRALCEDTHKFESHYAFALLFEPGASEDDKARIFHERSPCLKADKITAPLMLLQGDEDRVVPLNQAEEMVEMMKKAGREAKLVIFPGEGHGFRQAKSRIHAVEEEEKWWKKALLGMEE
ncbi:CAZyme family CE10 [Penicillium sp. DV-2018c]|nr:CAZyme family CE10 [Penicillium sp. DV-2018c]